MKRLKRFSVAALLVSAAAGCAGPMQPVSVPGAEGLTIPRGALNAMKAQWSNAEPGRPGPGACLGASSAPAPLVTGDFNGDGHEDVAVWATVNGAPRLAALFSRTDGEFTLTEVGNPEAVATGMLEVAPRGASHHLPPLTVELYFGLDTVILRECDGSRTAWFWTGDGFEGQPLAD